MGNVLEQCRGSPKSPKVVVNPSTRIAYFSSASSVGRITIDKRNLDSTIGQFCRRRPELGSLSVEIICVLGTGDQYRRQLYTDWLIQYFQCRGNKDKSVQEWIKHWHARASLKFVESCGDPGNTRQTYQTVQPGVHIWPTPLIERDASNDRTVCWVMFIIAPQEQGENDSLLDVFAAGTSSKIVTFENSDKDQIITSAKDTVGYRLMEGNFLNVWSSRNLMSSMEIFLTKFEEKPIMPMQYNTSLLTSNSFGNHLEEIAKIINDYTFKKRQEKSDIANNNQIPVGKDMSTENHNASLITQDEVKNLQDESKAPVKTDSSKQIVHLNRQDLKPRIDVEDVQTINSVVVNKHSRQQITHKTLTELPPHICRNNDQTSTNNFQITSKHDPKTAVRNITTIDIDTWIKYTLTFQNIHMLQDHFIQSVNLSSPQDIQEDLFILQTRIESLNKNLINMYDNYVCFDGDLDLGQMQKFMATYFHHSTSSWNSNGVKNPNIIKSDLLTTTYHRLRFLYSKDNTKIIDHETTLVKQVCKNILNLYQIKIRRYVGQNTDNALDNHYSTQLVEFNRRLISYCITTIGRTLDLGGKLSNVVRRHIDTFKHSLTQIYEQVTCTLKEIAQLEMPRHQEQHRSYFMGIQQAIYCQDCFDAKKIKQTHDNLVDKVTDKMNITEKDKFKLYVDSLFVNMVENEFVRRETVSLAPNSITLFITNKFIYAYTSLGENPAQLIPFSILSHSNEVVSGHFRNEVGITKADGVILFGNELMNRSDADFKCMHRFLDYFKKSNVSQQTLKATITHVLSRYKTVLEKHFQTSFQQVQMVISSWLSFEERLLVRESCKQTGFEKTCILMESSIAAYKLLNEMVPQSGQFLVLVVIALENGVRMEMYGKQDGGIPSEENESISLLAVFYMDWLHENNLSDVDIFVSTIKASYTETLSQLTEEHRNSITKYVRITRHRKWNRILDSYLQDVENIEKADDLTQDSVLPIINQLRNREMGMENLLLGLSKPFNFQRNNINTSSSSQQVPTRNNELYEKCVSIEHQVVTGKVKVGTLRKKIILEIIQRGKLAAEEGLIRGEDDEIEELCRLYDLTF